jgi:hypothetical protein
MAYPANPYTPPATSVDTGTSKVAPSSGWPLGPGALLGVSIALFALTVGLSIQSGSVVLGVIGLALSTTSAVWGLVRGVRRLDQVKGRGSRTAAIFSILGNLLMAGFGALIALWAASGFSRGRQLRRFGRVLLPPVRSGGSWANSAIQVSVPESSRAALAARWRENGRTEHASVAAFARLTLDLMALGAPPELVSAAQRDALDEIRHTELCFSLARALDGSMSGPGPFPEPQRARRLPRGRTLALARLAVDSLVEGALHEGVSARILSKLSARSEEPSIGAVLRELAADEGRHAAHGWQVVVWCLRESDSSVAHALRGALRVVPSRIGSPLHAEAADGSWERWGIPGHALEEGEYASARAQVARRLEQITSARSGGGA